MTLSTAPDRLCRPRHCNEGLMQQHLSVAASFARTVWRATPSSQWTSIVLRLLDGHTQLGRSFVRPARTGFAGRTCAICALLFGRLALSRTACVRRDLRLGGGSLGLPAGRRLRLGFFGQMRLFHPSPRIGGWACLATRRDKQKGSNSKGNSSDDLHRYPVIRRSEFFKIADTWIFIARHFLARIARRLTVAPSIRSASTMDPPTHCKRFEYSY